VAFLRIPDYRRISSKYSRSYLRSREVAGRGTLCTSLRSAKLSGDNFVRQLFLHPVSAGGNLWGTRLRQISFILHDREIGAGACRLVWTR